MRNIILYGEIEEPFVPTEPLTTEWDDDFTTQDWDDLAYEIVVEFTGEPMFDVIEVLHTYGCKWEDVKEIVKLFYPIYNTITRREALRQSVMEGWLFRTEKVSYARLCKRVSLALIRSDTTQEEDVSQWQTP